MRVLYLLLLVALPAAAVDPVETPMLGLEVSSGRLPPVQKRLPQQPLVVSMENVGRHGGTLNSLVGRSRDTRLLVVYGYARLVAYDRSFEGFCRELEARLPTDFGWAGEVTARAVYATLSERIDEGEARKVPSLLPQRLRGLWPLAPVS